MIEIKELTKKFGEALAVNHISFQVAKGENLAILGTSGSGKTTTLKMLNRVIEPTSGDVKINGENILSQAPHLLRRQIGYVIQNIGLFPHLTIAENIMTVPKLLGWEKQKMQNRVSELLEQLHLPLSYGKAYPSQLSGGQQQRVGVARALAADPPVVLMDEPLGALDPVTRRQIRQEFLQLDTLQKKTLLVVTHDIEEAIELGDRICLMDKGKIQQIGTAKELILKPANAFVKQFFEENRFQFLMKVFKLKDIFPSLSIKGDFDGKIAKVNVESDIATSLQKFDGEAKAIKVQYEGQTKIVSMANLLEAFQVQIEKG